MKLYKIITKNGREFTLFVESTSQLKELQLAQSKSKGTYEEIIFLSPISSDVYSTERFLAYSKTFV